MKPQKKNTKLFELGLTPPPPFGKYPKGSSFFFRLLPLLYFPTFLHFYISTFLNLPFSTFLHFKFSTFLHLHFSPFPLSKFLHFYNFTFPHFYTSTFPVLGGSSLTSVQPGTCSLDLVLGDSLGGPVGRVFIRCESCCPPGVSLGGDYRSTAEQGTV